MTQFEKHKNVERVGLRSRLAAVARLFGAIASESVQMRKDMLKKYPHIIDP